MKWTIVCGQKNCCANDSLSQLRLEVITVLTILYHIRLSKKYYEMFYTYIWLCQT